MAAKRELYAGLLYIARERRYSDGWAAHSYRKKFGVWPRLGDVQPQRTQVAENWAKYLRIRYAKERQKLREGENQGVSLG